MFDAFDEDARRSLFWARHSLVQTGGAVIEDLHVLLGVLRAAPAAVTRFTNGWTAASLQDRIAGAFPGGEPLSTSVEVPFAATAMRLVEAAIRSDPFRVRPEHLVLAMLDDASSPAARLLAEAGVGATAIRAFLEADAAGVTSTVDPPASLRLAILELLQAAFAGEFSDGDWANALGGTHLAIASEGAIVAHASVVPRVLEIGGQPIRVGYVEAVAVRPDLQRAGLGTRVMQAAAVVIAREFALGALSSGEWPFYERLGWERWRGPTWVRHADGRRERTPDDDGGVMILRVPRSPAIDVTSEIAGEARDGDPW